MIQNTFTIEIDRPVEEVYDFIADPANDGRWRTEVISSELVAGESGQPDAQYKQVMKQGRREVESTHEIVAVDPPHRIDWRTPEGEGPLTFAGYYACEPHGEGTRFTIHAKVTPHGTFRLMQPLMRPFLTRVSRRYANDLKKTLEGRASSK